MSAVVFKTVVPACSISSYRIQSLGGKTPLQAASRLLPKDLLGELGIVRMRPDEVVLKPSLLGGNR